MALSREEIERRKAANREIMDRAGGSGADEGRILNISSKDVRQAHVDLLLVPVPGLGFVTFSQHWFQEKTEFKGRDGADPRFGIFPRTFVCSQSSKWHFQARVDKKYPSPPSCPIEKLIAYVAEHPELHAEELFRFGEGCTLKDGRPVEPRSVTGADLIGHGDGPLAFQRSFVAQEKTLFLVLPLSSRIDGKDTAYDPGYRFMLESYTVVKAHVREYKTAVEQYGEDIAGNFSAPAVFRWSYDNRDGRTLPANRWSSRFLEKATRDIAPEFVELWESDVPEDVVAEVKAIVTPGDPENIGRALHDAFCGGFDLAAVSGLPRGDVFDEAIAAQEERKPAPVRAVKPANGEQVRRTVKRAEPAGPPCGECNKPCPASATKCPHCGAEFAEDAPPADPDGIPW